MHFRRLILAQALAFTVGLGVMLSAPAVQAQASDEAAFTFKDPVKCGPDGTLTFKAGAKVRIYDAAIGRFEFTGEAKEESRRDEDYVITLTFRDFDRKVLFRMASEPFEMPHGKTTTFRVHGTSREISRYFSEVQFIDLDCQVPFEPLYEDAFDYFGYVVRYHRTQDLEAQAFDVD
jgi:hypothetical protein